MDPDRRPDLEPGLALLERPERRSNALHHLVVDAVEASGGPTLWVDARSHASTYALFDVAPHRRLLSGLQVARAFTAYQHHTLVRELARRADRETQLVVVPAVDSLYRDDDLGDREAVDLLASGLSVLSGLADALDVPVLVTGDSVGDGDALGGLVADHADRTIACRRTDEGYYFETEGFATRCYVGQGYWQTTIPYWVELCGIAEELGHPALAAELARVGMGGEGGMVGGGSGVGRGSAVGSGSAQPTLAGSIDTSTATAFAEGP